MNKEFMMQSDVRLNREFQFHLPITGEILKVRGDRGGQGLCWVYIDEPGRESANG